MTGMARLGRRGVGRRAALAAAALLAAGVAGRSAAQGPGGPVVPPVPPPPTILGVEARPIDLSTALRLADVQNPELLLARQRVVESQALRQLAAAQILPTINAGANYDDHTGALQQSNGNILSVNRSSVYVGAGAGAIGSGTVTIPGITLGGNAAEGVYAYLVSRQVVRRSEFAGVAARNDAFLAATLAYCELTRAEGRLAIGRHAAAEARQVADLTGNYARFQEGRPADANRAASELAAREAVVQEAEGDLLVASAGLCRVLGLDPSVRLHPTDAFVVPHPIVPDPTPACELIALALLRRPELAAQRSAIRAAFLSLRGAKVLPFSPTAIVGFSAGGFGGGSNLVSPAFGSFNSRADFDAIGYWTIRNLGVGNLALIRLADARLKAARFEELAILNRVRAEVAEAHARSHARYARIGVGEQAVRAGLEAFREDYDRILARGGREVLPVELLNSFRLLARAREDYLGAIVDYNRSQFELFVALGQPPADALARPVPTDGLAPSNLRSPADPSAAPPPPPAGGPGPFAASAAPARRAR